MDNTKIVEAICEGLQNVTLTDSRDPELSGSSNGPPAVPPKKRRSEHSKTRAEPQLLIYTASERLGLTLATTTKHDLWIHHVWEACRKGDWIDVYFYLEKSSHLEFVLNGVDYQGNTALIIAAAAPDVNGGSPQILDLLLDFGADGNAMNRSGRTALMEAALWGRKKNVEVLLKRKWASQVDIEREDYSGWSAVRLAGTEECCRWERMERGLKEGVVQYLAFDDRFRADILELLQNKTKTGTREGEKHVSSAGTTVYVDGSTWMTEYPGRTSTYVSTSTQTDPIESPPSPVLINATLEIPCDHFNDILFEEELIGKTRVVNISSIIHINLPSAQDASIATLRCLTRHLQSKTLASSTYHTASSNHHDTVVAKLGACGRCFQVPTPIDSFELRPRPSDEPGFNKAAMGCIGIDGDFVFTRSGRFDDGMSGMLNSHKTTALVCELADTMEYEIDARDASHVEPQLMTYFIQHHLQQHKQELNLFGRTKILSKISKDVAVVTVWVDRPSCRQGTCEAFKDAVNSVTEECYGFRFELVDASDLGRRIRLRRRGG